MKTSPTKYPVSKVKKTDSVTQPSPAYNSGMNSNSMNKTGQRPAFQSQPLAKMPSMGGAGGDARVAAATGGSATRGLNPEHAADIQAARKAKY
jgi:hypothetical protein